MAGLCTLAFAATEIIALGWKTATINTSTYNNPPDSLTGTGWIFEIVDTNASKVTAGASKALRGTQVSSFTIIVPQVGIVKYDYKLRTTSSVPSNPTTTVKYTYIGTATSSAEVVLVGAGRVGTGSGDVMGASSSSIATDSAPGLNSNSAGPTTKKDRFVFPGASWVTESGGWKAFTFRAGFSQEAMATAKNPAGAPNYTVVSGGGTSVGKFYVSSFSNKTGTAEVLTGTTDSFLDRIEVDVCNDNGVPLDSTGLHHVDGQPGDIYFLMDEYAAGNYRLYWYSPNRSLRKRINIAWDPAVGMSGVNLQLVYGDLNNDGYVSQSEVDFIYSCIGRTEQDANYTWYLGDDPAELGFKPRDADINGDAAVTTADYNLASPNVGAYGDQEELTLLGLIARHASKSPQPARIRTG